MQTSINKRFIQLFILLIILIISIFFHQKYLKVSKKQLIQKTSTNNELKNQGVNNTIQNLEYRININKNSQYFISSEISELIDDTQYEKINMKIVKAAIIEDGKKILQIKSKNAIFDNSKYQTNFKNNVIISYQDHKIFSNNLNLNLKDNNVKIFGNVRYHGLYGELTADNIDINITTKEMNIYMNDKSNKVIINKK